MKTIGLSILGGAAEASSVIVVVGLIGLPQVVDFADKHEGLAGWLQAIFSVVAIWFAVALLNLESRQRDASVMDAFAGVCEVVRKLIDDAANAAEAQLLGSHTLATFPTRMFGETLQLLNAVPTFDLGSSSAAQLVIDLKKSLMVMEAHVVAGAATFYAPLPIAEIRRVKLETDLRCDLVQQWRAGRNRRAARWWWPAAG